MGETLEYCDVESTFVDNRGARRRLAGVYVICDDEHFPNLVADSIFNKSQAKRSVYQMRSSGSDLECSSVELCP